MLFHNYRSVLNTFIFPIILCAGGFVCGLVGCDASRELHVTGRIPEAGEAYHGRLTVVFDRPLHDRLLRAVLEADPRASGLTLSNTLARHEARRLLDGSEEFF